VKPDEVRRRAAAGAIFVAAKDVTIQLVALAGSIVFAHYLLPSELGLYALAATVTLVLATLIGPALASGLIRQPEPPDRADLETLFAVQLGLAVVVAPLTALAAIPFGRPGQVVALMALTLPLAAIRAPGVIMLERELVYRRLVVAEVAEVVAYYGCGVAGVLAGWHVWALAIALVVKAAVGSSLVAVLAPGVLVRPRFSAVRARRLLGLGLRIQATDALNLVRDHGLNIGAAAFGGLGVLGLWTLGARLAQAPGLLLSALWRVSFPAMSRLVAAGEEPRPLIERTVRVVAVAFALMAVPLVAAAPAFIPAVFGARWASAANVVPGVDFALMISVPPSVAMIGYLWATGDARTPLRAVILHTIALGGVTFPLLPVLGLPAIGVGWVASGLVDATVLCRAARARTGARVVRALALPSALAVVAGAIGWVGAAAGEATLLRAAAAAVVAEGIFLAGIVVLRRQLLDELFRVLARALHATTAQAPA
jgi:O-antigen/teichoic acid export membrane protein